MSGPRGRDSRTRPPAERPAGETAPPPRHPSGRVVAFIWIAVVGFAFVAAIFLQDDNPNADDPAAFGALAAMVAGIVTVVYVLGSLVLNPFRELRVVERAPALDEPPRRVELVHRLVAPRGRGRPAP